MVYAISIRGTNTEKALFLAMKIPCENQSKFKKIRNLRKKSIKACYFKPTLSGAFLFFTMVLNWLETTKIRFNSFENMYEGNPLF